MVTVPPVLLTQTQWTTWCRAADEGRRGTPLLAVSTLPGSRVRPGTPPRFTSRTDAQAEHSTTDLGLQAPPGTPTRAVIARIHGREFARLCTGVPVLDEERSISQGVGPVVVVPPRERIVGLSAAGRWVAVATNAGRRASTRLRWFHATFRSGAPRPVRLAGIKRTVRLTGTFDAITPATTGEVVSTVRIRRRQRLVLHEPSGRNVVLVGARRATSAARPLTAWLWGPRTIALTPYAQRGDEFGLIGLGTPERVLELPFRRAVSGCTRADDQLRRRTSALDVRVGTTPGMVGLAEEQHLRICTPAGQLLVEDGVGSDPVLGVGIIVSAVSIVGRAVVLGTQPTGEAKDGASTAVLLVPTDGTPATTVRVNGPSAGDRMIAFSPHAVAWLASDGLWLADADGARLVASDIPGAPDRRIESIAGLSDTMLLFERGARTPSGPVERIAVKPLAANLVTLDPRHVPDALPEQRALIAKLPAAGR